MGRSEHLPVGLTHHTASAAWPGYTLVVTNRGDQAVLVDMEGRPCHRWRYDEGISYAYLLPNGNLLCRPTATGDVEMVKGLGGSASAIVELDWDGARVWEYRDPMLHHDYVRLPNGNTLAVLWQPMPAIARPICGARCGNGTACSTSSGASCTCKSRRNASSRTEAFARSPRRR